MSRPRGRRTRDKARIGFGRGDQIGNGLPRRSVRDRQNVRVGADQRHRPEIGFRIVVDRLDHQAVERNCAADPDHRVTVRIGVRGNINGEMAASACFRQ